MTNRILRTLLAGLLCILSGAVFAQSRESHSDEQQFVTLTKATFDQPQAPLAKTLADKLAAAEHAMPPATSALFATFEGVVHIGADGQHPPAHHRQHGQHPPHK
jgi:hypothetical protein